MDVIKPQSIKVSVTVPVYNTSKYLRKCLDSLAAQTLNGIEFILVDDGSSDNSGIICDEYASKDTRFKVIRQQNSGSAAARQTGLDAAKGEYVIVCDSDDWVEPDMYEKLYQKAKETDADIVCCGYYTEYDDGRSVPKQTIFREKEGVIDNTDFIKHISHSSWNKLIKKSLFLIANAEYINGINLGEDALIILKLLMVNPVMVQMKDNLYHYRRLIGSASYTNNITNSSIQQLLYKYEWLKNNYTSIEYDNLKKDYASSIVFSYIRCNHLTDKSCFYSFLKTEFPWRKALNLKNNKRLIVLASKVLPYRAIKLLYKLSYKFFYK